MNTQDFAYTKEKPPATFRIAVVGDSFSYAPKMQFDDSFSKRLERYLNLNAPRDGQNSVGKSTEGFNRAEVINFSVPGLNTAQEVEVVRQALTYNPDLVLLQITLNDPQLRPLNLEPPEVQQKYGRLPLDLNSSFITRHSALARLIWTRLHNQATIGNYIEYHRQLFAPGESRDRFLTAIDRINSISRSSDTSPGLVAVLFPLFDFPLDQSYPFAQIHKALSQEFKDRKIPLLDLFSAFRGIPTVRLQLIPGIDSHPNEIAHRIAAERILRWLAKRNLVPRSLAPSRVVNQRDNVKEPLARRSSRSKAQRSDKNQSATPVERKDF